MRVFKVGDPKTFSHTRFYTVCLSQRNMSFVTWPSGEIQFPGRDLRLPAVPGLEYPDPGGSGLRVPVLGSQLDWASGRMVPLAGTMEDANGGGVCVCVYGCGCRCATSA